MVRRTLAALGLALLLPRSMFQFVEKVIVLRRVILFADPDQRGCPLDGSRLLCTKSSLVGLSCGQ
jgi:hypothetical protein